MKHALKAIEPGAWWTIRLLKDKEQVVRDHLWQGQWPLNPFPPPSPPRPLIKYANDLINMQIYVNDLLNMQIYANDLINMQMT